MIIRPVSSLPFGSSSEVLEGWLKSAVGRHVDSVRGVFSLRHVGRSAQAFEVELESETAHVWLSSTEDRVVSVDWRQRPRPETSGGAIVIDAYLRLEDAGLNLGCIGDDLANELGDEHERRVCLTSITKTQ